jgi:hypothetical protein
MLIIPKKLSDVFDFTTWHLQSINVEELVVDVSKETGDWFRL